MALGKLLYHTIFNKYIYTEFMMNYVNSLLNFSDELESKDAIIISSFSLNDYAGTIYGLIMGCVESIYVNVCLKCYDSLIWWSN